MHPFGAAVSTNEAGVKWPWIFFGITLAVLSVPITGGMQFFVSHLFVIIFAGIAFLICFRTRPVYASAAVCWLLVFLFLNAVSGLYAGLGDRYLQDLIKIIIYIFCIAFVSQAYRLNLLQHIGAGISIGICIFVFISVFVLGNVSFSAGRLLLDNAGGANTFGSCLAVSLIYIVSYRYFPTYARILLTLVILAILLATGSRTNVASAILVIVYGPHLLKRVGVAAAIAAAGAIVLFMVVDVSALIEKASGIQRILNATGSADPTSGRFGIWAFLLRDLTSDYLSIFLGRGPGSVDFMHLRLFPFFWVLDLASPHSTWMGALYYFGFFGIVIFACLNVYAGILAFKSGSLIRQRLFIYYVLAMMPDNHFMGSQGIIYHAIAFAILFAPIPGQRHDPEQKGVDGRDVLRTASSPRGKEISSGTA